MAKFVFVVPPLTGHVNPTLSLGAELLRNGHEVGWISLDAALEHQLPEGGKLMLVQYEKSDAAKEEARVYLDVITRKDVYGVESVKFLYEEVLVPLNRYMYDGIVEWLLRYQPDVLINDHQLFAGAIAAWKLDIDYATSVTAPAAVKMQEDLPMVHQWEMQQMLALQKELGVEEAEPVICSSQLTLVYTSRAFFGDMVLPEYYRFTGPVLQNRHAPVGFDWERFNSEADKPRILVSIGTTFNHEHKREFFSKVKEALKDEPVTVVVVSEPDLFDDWPDNFIVQKRVPQMELLPYLNGVMCHAGHNTVCETLMNGLPLVVVPIAYDQSYVAGRVVQVNAGVRLHYKRCKPAHIKEAVWEMLNNPEYKAAAEAIKNSFAEAGGTAQAARLLEELVNRIEYC